jgi:hypothetical protein
MFNRVGQFSVAVDTQLLKYSNGSTIADHAFHEFSSLRLATEETGVRSQFSLILETIVI